MSYLIPVTLLVALWLLAWGDVTVANVLSGVLLAALLLATFRSTRQQNARLRPVATLRLLLYVSGRLVVSNVLVAREVLSRRSRIRTGVIRYRVRQPSDEVLTVMSNIIALSPGTMVVDVGDDPPELYLHFLLLNDVAEARQDIARLETRVVAVFGPPDPGAGAAAPAEARPEPDPERRGTP